MSAKKLLTHIPIENFDQTLNQSSHPGDSSFLKDLDQKLNQVSHLGMLNQTLVQF